MNKIFYTPVTISFFLALLALLLFGPHVSAATKVPDFALPMVQDKSIVDIKKLRGQIVLVNFWATWCGPCLQELPSLASLQKKFRPFGLTIVGISIDQNSTKTVKRMINKTGVNYPVVIDDGSVSRKFGGISGVPTSFLIDRSGTIVKRYTGYVPHNVLEKEIKAVLN